MDHVDAFGGLFSFDLKDEEKQAVNGPAAHRADLQPEKHFNNPLTAKGIRSNIFGQERMDHLNLSALDNFLARMERAEKANESASVGILQKFEDELQKSLKPMSRQHLQSSMLKDLRQRGAT